jgi:hypothetical protein
MAHGTIEFSTLDLEGVYSGIDVFPSDLWDCYSDQDAAYAAQELHALWLSILAGLTCPVVNPPALDALAGTLLAPAELFVRAREAGLDVPAVAYVETGAAAAALGAEPALLTFRDLGVLGYQEHRLGRDMLEVTPTRDRQIRVREWLSGETFSVVLAGERPFLAASNPERQAPCPRRPSGLPDGLLDRLLCLQRRLGLCLAEYTFSVSERDGWVLQAVQRRPGDDMIRAHGDELLAAILALVRGQRVP